MAQAAALVEANGNTSLYASIYTVFVDPSTGLERQSHNIGSAYVQIGGNSINLEPTPFTAPMVPRAAEVKNGFITVIAGIYPLPISPGLEQLTQASPPDWNILTFDARGNFSGFVKSPAGQNWWENSELKQSQYTDVITGLPAVNLDINKSATKSRPNKKKDQTSKRKRK
jgi:hypothetical protein